MGLRLLMLVSGGTSARRACPVEPLASLRSRCRIRQELPYLLHEIVAQPPLGYGDSDASIPVRLRREVNSCR
jgi:hypothetical protein